MSETVYGQIIVAHEVAQAAADTLKTWFPAYLQEIEFQLEIPRHSLPIPESYTIAEELDLDLGMPTPAIVVVSPGLSGRNLPKKEGDGTYRVFFDISAGVVVEANNRPATRKLVRMYTAVMRAILLQKADLRGADWSNKLAGMADGSEWINESYDDRMPFADSQTISMGEVTFEIEVVGVVNRYGGPATPSTEPDTEWGLVQSATATVEPKEG